MKVTILLIAYFLIVNITGMVMMFIDKRRAIKRAYRIPEANLFLIALIGGSIGSIAGMYLFRHKTRHWYFVYGMPFILLIQLALALFLIFGPLNIVFL